MKLRNVCIATSDICTALQGQGVIGSKVTDEYQFMVELHNAVADHDFSADRVPGQGFIHLPKGIPFVSAGVGKPVPDTESYTLRLYRGKVQAFLKRGHAAPVENLHCVVYTLDAYVRDPDVTPEEVVRLVKQLDDEEGPEATHVLVAVLASAGPQSQLGTYRFTANLAGGNREAQLWTADEIRAKAREIMDYDQAWQTVAD